MPSRLSISLLSLIFFGWTAADTAGACWFGCWGLRRAFCCPVYAAPPMYPVAPGCGSCGQGAYFPAAPAITPGCGSCGVSSYYGPAPCGSCGTPCGANYSPSCGGEAAPDNTTPVQDDIGTKAPATDDFDGTGRSTNPSENTTPANNYFPEGDSSGGDAPSWDKTRDPVEVEPKNEPIPAFPDLPPGAQLRPVEPLNWNGKIAVAFQAKRHRVKAVARYQIPSVARYSVAPGTPRNASPASIASR